MGPISPPHLCPKVNFCTGDSVTALANLSVALVDHSVGCNPWELFRNPSGTEPNQSNPKIHGFAVRAAQTPCSSRSRTSTILTASSCRLHDPLVLNPSMPTVLRPMRRDGGVLRMTTSLFNRFPSVLLRLPLDD